MSLLLYTMTLPPDTNPPDFALSGQFWIHSFMLVLVPLAFLRRLDSLRHTSYVALFSVGEWILFGPRPTLSLIGDI